VIPSRQPASPTLNPTASGPRGASSAFGQPTPHPRHGSLPPRSARYRRNSTQTFPGGPASTPQASADESMMLRPKPPTRPRSYLGST